MKHQFFFFLRPPIHQHPIISPNGGAKNNTDQTRTRRAQADNVELSPRKRCLSRGKAEAKTNTPEKKNKFSRFSTPRATHRPDQSRWWKSSRFHPYCFILVTLPNCRSRRLLRSAIVCVFLFLRPTTRPSSSSSQARTLESRLSIIHTVSCQTLCPLACETFERKREKKNAHGTTLPS